jgi:hypothetical protein
MQKTIRLRDAKLARKTCVTVLLATLGEHLLEKELDPGLNEMLWVVRRKKIKTLLGCSQTTELVQLANVVLISLHARRHEFHRK